jgi:hypothetical protein
MADQRLNIIFSGDGTELTKTISELESQLRRFEQGLKTTSGVDSFLRVNRAIDATKVRLDALRGSAKGFGDAMTRVGPGTQSATFAITNLGRVLQDSSFGFIGIANNLNPLLESFQRLRAQAGSTAGAMKLLGSSLMGAGGVGLALSAVTAILQFSQLGFSAWTRGFSNAAKGAGESAREIKSATEVLEDATDSVQGEVARVNALVAAATNVGNSFKVQANAISELQKINKAYFGDLQAGKSTFEQITAAANGYTNALIQQAIVKGLQDEISETSKQLRAANKEYAATTKAANALRIARDKAASSGKVSGIAATNSELVRAQNAYDNFSAKLLDTGQKAGKLQADLNDLFTEIQKQVGIGLTIKPLDTKEFKGSTDDTLALARKFVKEFGDAFVLPDLSDTFFSSEKELKKAAKTLLDNVKRFVAGETNALQIRVPITFEESQISETVTKDIQSLNKVIQSLKPVTIDITSKGISEVKKEIDSIKDKTVTISLKQLGQVSLDDLKTKRFQFLSNRKGMLKKSLNSLRN